MTREQIQAMTDRELDAAVAESIFGWTRWEGPFGHKCFGPPDGGDQGCPEFSTDWSAMGEVVERFDVGFIQLDNGWRGDPHTRGWTCRIVAPGEEGEATASTLPRAVCIAALLAVGGSR